jgi:hypothetical protein
MKLRTQLWCWTLALALGLGGTCPAMAQGRDDSQHVVSLDELKQQTATPAEARAKDEAAVRHLLSSDVGQEALKSAHVEYRQVDKAIAQLDNQELARLAARSRQAESDFAAGFISAKTLAYIILALVVIIVIAVLV